jgi:hypothetical protein
MKKYLFSLLFIFASLNLSAQSADEEVGEYINSSDFFSLNERYPVLKDKIQSPMLNVFSEALLNGLFNRPEQAVASIDVLVRDYQGEIGFGNVQNMLMWQNNILFRMGEYCEASDRMDRFLEQAAPQIDTAAVKGLRKAVRYYASMCGQAKSELIRPDEDCVIPIYIEPVEIKGFRKGDMIYVPVTVGCNEEKFIFDTGCPGGAFMSEEYAQRLGVKIVFDSLEVNGMGGSGLGKMGMLDSLRIGNMTFKNPVIIVTPPNLAVDSVFKVNAVLGSDIMKQAGEVWILAKEKKIIFPAKKTPLPTTGRNLILNGDDLFSVKVYSGEEQLIMHFDTGDSSAGLNAAYYLKHKEDVERQGKQEKTLSGGYGGIVESEGYNLPAFPLRVGDKSFVMKNIKVNSDPTPVVADKDGSLGTAFIQLFDKVTVSFDRMFVAVE